MGAVRAVRLGSPFAAAASSPVRTSRSRSVRVTPLSGNRLVIRFGTERIGHSTLKPRSQIRSDLFSPRSPLTKTPLTTTQRRSGRSQCCEGSPAAIAKDQLASGWGTRPSSPNSLTGEECRRCFRLAATARRDWKRALVGGERVGRTGLVPLVWVAVPAFTQSASPIQLYFGVANPAIGIAALARELLQNLQRL